MIDVIGVLYAPMAAPDGWRLGDPHPAAVALEGWHVNATPETLAARPELEPYRVTPHPGTLMRVWAGDDPADPAFTVPLRFADEASARAVIG